LRKLRTNRLHLKNILPIKLPDGIQKQTHPGKPYHENIWEMSPKELKKVPKLPGSLQEALEALKVDHEFLTNIGVMSEEFIEMWIA